MTHRLEQYRCQAAVADGADAVTEPPVRRHDEHFYLQRFTPRRKRSKWSQNNVEKADAHLRKGKQPR